MSNPAFDAALLLRGLRAMDAALGETYNVMNHTCIPAPVVYSGEFPQAGINFSKYQGITGIQNSWRGWMYEDGGTGKLKTTVHEDVEATVVEAFGILERCDKSKDGLVTKSEWETCQKGKSADDQLFDLEYLLALDNVTGKMLILEKDQPLNPADPNTYPELIQNRKDMTDMAAKKDGQISNLTTEFDKTKDSASFYQTMTYGLGSALGVVTLVLGARAAWRKSKKPLHPEAQRAIAKEQTPDGGIPKPTAQIGATPARIEPPATGGGDYGDVLSNLGGAQTPNESVLQALAGEEEAVADEEAAQAVAAPPPLPSI